MMIKYKRKKSLQRSSSPHHHHHHHQLFLFQLVGLLLALEPNFLHVHATPYNSESTPSLSSSSASSSNAENGLSLETCSELLIWSSSSLLPASAAAKEKVVGSERDLAEDYESFEGRRRERVSAAGTTDDDESLSSNNEELSPTKAKIRKENEVRRKEMFERQRALKLNVNQMLRRIDNLSKGHGIECTTPSNQNYIFSTIPIGTHVYNIPKEKADLIAYFMSNSIYPPPTPNKSPPKNSKVQVYTQTQFPDMKKLEANCHSLYDEPQVENIHFLEYFYNSPNHTIHEKTHSSPTFRTSVISADRLKNLPWYFDPNMRSVNHGNGDRSLEGKFMRANETLYAQLMEAELNSIKINAAKDFRQQQNIIGFWSWPYFQCNNKPEMFYNDKPLDDKLKGKWLISYSVGFRLSSHQNSQPFSFGLLSFDIDLTMNQINQCSFSSEEERAIELEKNPMFIFRETHKCNPESTECHFAQVSNHTGWRKGNYECHCKKNNFAYDPTWNNKIRGYAAESTWCTKITNDTLHAFLNEDEKKNKSPSLSSDSLSLPSSFKEIVSCSPCPPECPDCINGKSCLAEMNVAVRLMLLCISIICSIATIGLIITVYKYRKLPLLKNSSPIFLCITLTGCIIMYSEMVALFPPLTVATCIAVKWTRHLGFCVTYTALYMKLCRVYLTYRVKSAHKIKLTEKHLLHWMSPIMVIMLLYLFAWTISHPPEPEILITWHGKNFTQCIYNWWDHSLAIGEFIFLTYGVWICWRIRDNPDAQFISYSIYNIAVVNSVMACLHLIIAPKAGPDLKYLFAFLRTQLSTTVTIALVLGTKLYHIIRGDAASKKEIVNSANGFGHESLDLAEENQQLKEELHKMATQMERLKSYAMCKNNPHLKSIPNDKDLGRLDSFTAL